MSNFIIGFSGPKRSGKDFGADILHESLSQKGLAVYRTSFAKALRQFATFVSGCDPRQIDIGKDVGDVEFNIDFEMMMVWLRQVGVLGELYTATEYRSVQRNWETAIRAECDQQMVNNPKLVAHMSPRFNGIELRGSGRDLLIILGQAARRASVSFWTDLLLREVEQFKDTYVIVTDVRPVNEAMVCDFIIEVDNPDCKFEGTATEAKLPPHLVSIVVFNPGDVTYLHNMRAIANHAVCRKEAREVLARPLPVRYSDSNRVMSAEMFNRTFIKEV